MTKEEEKTKTQKPTFRYALKSEIIGAGHKTVTDFSKKTGIDMPRLSQVINGYLYPGPHLQRKMAECLGITLGELKELLK